MKLATLQRIHILSFDLEEWFYLYSSRTNFDAEVFWQKSPLRVEKVVDQLLELLNVNGSTATFFTMGRLARAYPAMIRRIVAEGHELGAHSHIHAYANRQSLQQFRGDLQMNLKVLEDLVGFSVEAYRTPAYTIDTRRKEYRDVLLELGIKRDSSLKSGASGLVSRIPNHPFKISGDTQLTYFPVSTWPIFNSWPYASSGFFRVMPKSIVMRQLKRPGYHMFYFHPRDFDPAMYSLPSELINRLKYGLGTVTSISHLQRILEQFSCRSMASVEQGLLFSPNILEVNE